MNWRDYIVTDPEILVGKPAVKGTRLSVDLILDRLADGWTAEDLYQAYPRLTRCRRYLLLPPKFSRMRITLHTQKRLHEAAAVRQRILSLADLTSPRARIGL